MLNQHRLLLIVSAALMFFLCSSCGSETSTEPAFEVAETTKASDQESQDVFREVISPPTLSLIQSRTLNENNLVSFGFRSSKAGTISYSGSCISSTRNAIEGDHHIRFVMMVEGTYDDCAIQVTDSDGNKSEPLRVPSFKVDFTVPELSQIGDLKVEVRSVEV